MGVQRKWIAALSAVVCLTASAQETKPDAELRGGYTTYVESHLQAGEGLLLKLTKFEKRYDRQNFGYISVCSGSGIPDRVLENSEADFCYGSFHDDIDFKDYDTGYTAYYDILVPNGSGGWRPSGYYVDLATKVPMFGERQLACTVRQSGSTIPGVPFRCESFFTGKGERSSPHWKVTANEVKVIDAADSANVEEAAKLIGANCTIFDTPRCSWTRTQKSSAFLPDRQNWQSLTNWADSCPPTDPNRLFVLSSNRNVQISWSDKVGGKISGKISGELFLQKVEASVEASYEHTIGQTDSYGEGYQYTIPYNYRSALYLQHGLLQVSGDFSIVADNNDRYLIKNAVFQFPLEKDVFIEGRGQPVPRGIVQHVDVPCSQQAPANGAPPPLEAKVGLATKQR